MQGEQLVQRVGLHLADLVILARRGEGHVQEIAGIAEIVAWIDEGLAQGILESPGGDGRHLGDQPVRGDHPVFRVIEVQVIVVEGGERADGGAHHCHRMRVAAEAAEENLHLLLEHGVVGNRILELLQFLGVRKISLEQKIGDLEEMRLLGKLLDGIASVLQNALVTVDIGDLGRAASRRPVTRIVGEHAGIGIKFTDIDDIRANAARQDRVFPSPSVAIIRYGYSAGIGIRILCTHRLLPPSNK